MKNKLVHLAPGLSLPAAKLATTVTAILGIRGSGKSNLAAVIAEGFLDAKIPVIILDRVGIWFSLRLAPDGKKPSGYEIPVLGGVHGDIELSPEAGAEVAEALASSHSSAILDISRFSKSQRIKFATDFGEAFFEAKKRFPGPVSVMLEEAQKYIPQMIRFSGTGLERCLGAYEELAEQGRNYGAGLVLISLRPEKLNKDVVNLSDNIAALRTIGVHERKAIADWVQEKGVEGRSEVKNELPSLPEGNGIVWSPGIFNIYGKFKFRLKSTYDAGKTPERVRAAVKVKPLDLDKLQSAMKKIVEEAKTNDPKTLKNRVAELERQLAKRAADPKTVEKVVEKIVYKTVDRPVITERHLKRIEKISKSMLAIQMSVEKNAAESAKLHTNWVGGSKILGISLNEFINTARQISAGYQAPSNTTITTSPTSSATPTIIVKRRGPGKYKIQLPSEVPASFSGTTTITQNVPPFVDDNGELTAPAKAILSVLAQRKLATLTEIAVLSSYSKKSSGFSTAMAKLRKIGLITGTSKNLTLTEAGTKYTGSGQPLPTGKALYEHWLGRLTTPEATLLKALHDNDRSVSRGELANLANYSMKSSGFSTAIAALGRLGLIRVNDVGQISMVTELFK